MTSVCVSQFCVLYLGWCIPGAAANECSVNSDGGDFSGSTQANTEASTGAVNSAATAPPVDFNGR